MKVIKRDGRAVDYDRQKIAIAISKANDKIPVTARASKEEIKEIIEYVESLGKRRMLVEDIQDIIEEKLMEMNKFDLAKEYITYRYRRALVRKQNTTDESILGIIRNGVQESNNSNRKTYLAASQRDFIAGEVSRDLTKRLLLPERITKAYEQGILDFHNQDYFIQPIINSCFTRLADMLENGTEINGIKINKPKTFRQACETMAQIILSVSSNQYGEQTVDIMHLAKYISKSYNIIQTNIKEITKDLSEDCVKEITKKTLELEIKSSIKNLIYQLNTIMTSNGKLPLVTIVLHLDSEDEYLEEKEIIVKEILNQMLEYRNILSNNTFLKLLYVLNSLNNLSGEKYDYLTNLALKCSSERINISYISNNKFKKTYKEGVFNQGVVSINLPQIAIASDGNKDDFWNELEVRLDLCKEALMYKHYALLGTLSNVSPIHWQYGAISRMEENKNIDEILKGENSRLSITYVGVYETTYLIEGMSHTTKEGKDFSIKLITKIKDTVKKWTKETGLNFAIYEEETKDNLNYEFTKIDKEKYGTIPNITDKGYYINSYHISDKEELDELEKIKFESNFKNLLDDGTISYKLLSDLTNDDNELEKIIKFISNN